MYTGKLLPHLAFAFSSAIMLPSLLSVVFPALLVRMSSGSPVSIIDPFEPGFFAVPVIAANAAFFSGYAVLMKKKRGGHALRAGLRTVLAFDVSRKTSLLIIVSVIAVYVAVSFDETLGPETLTDYQLHVVPQMSSWLSSDNIADNLAQYHTKMFLLHSSERVFDNVRIVPLLASASLLFLVYFFTVQISSRRVSGLIAVGVMLQSYLFTTFDSTATYANFWLVFFLASLYLVEKRARMSSSISYLASIFSKPLTLAFLPFSIFYIARSRISKRQKVATAIPYAVIGSAVCAGLLFVFPGSDLLSDSDPSFHYHKFISGFTTLSYQLRFDPLVLAALFPLCFVLYQRSKNGDSRAESLQILVSGMILAGAILAGFLDFQTNPYRLVSLVVFFAVSFGYVFGNKRYYFGTIS